MIETSPLVRIQHPDEVQAEIQKKLDELNAAEAEDNSEPFRTSLAAHIRDRFTQAQTLKTTIETRLNTCKRAIKCQYDPRKLAAIQAIYGAEFDPPFPPVIATKRDDLTAWLKDLLLMPGVNLFSLDPTPIPDLPDGVEAKVEEKVKQKFMQAATQQAWMTGQPINMQAIMLQMEELLPAIKDKVAEELRKQSRESTMRMQHKIEDQFAEGGFMAELKDFIDDIATYPNAFLSGPVQKKCKVKKMVMDLQSGVSYPQIVDETISTYERISPYDVYPVNNTADINDTDIIILKASTAENLSNLIGVEGYDSDAIRAVLNLYRKGGLKEWTNVTSERDRLEDKDSSSNYDFIDRLEYQGTASGSMLNQWAGSEEKARALFGELEDEKEYQIVGWLIGDYVIKAMLNPDALGKKNISKTGFSTDPDNFWSNTSLPEKLWSDQSQCNTLSRNIALNVAFAAGPMVEYDEDRFPRGVSPNLYPLKQWAATSAQIAGNKAVNYYQPQLVVNAMTQAFEFYRSLADEHSGIPRYMQGSGDGMANTSSGFAMQIANQSRGLKSISINIYNDVISEVVDRQYQFNLEYEDIDMIGDCKVVPSGLASIVAKDQLALRRKEYLNEVTTNQVRTQLIGANGLKYMERQTAQTLDFDLDKIFGKDADIMEEVIDITPIQSLPNKGTPPKTREMDAAGQDAGGRPTGLFNEQKGQSSTVG